MGSFSLGCIRPTIPYKRVDAGRFIPFWFGVLESLAGLERWRRSLLAGWRRPKILLCHPFVVLEVRSDLPKFAGVFFSYHLKPMDLIITILPVVTKDLPISPRFTPHECYRGASSAILQLVNQWLNFTYSRSHAFRYGRKNANPAGKNRTHDFRTSRCAGYLLDHSGDGFRLLFQKRGEYNINKTFSHLRELPRRSPENHT